MNETPLRRETPCGGDNGGSMSSNGKLVPIYPPPSSRLASSLRTTEEDQAHLLVSPVSSCSIPEPTRPRHKAKTRRVLSPERTRSGEYVQTTSRPPHHATRFGADLHGILAQRSSHLCCPSPRRDWWSSASLPPLSPPIERLNKNAPGPSVERPGAVNRGLYPCEAQWHLRF